MNSPKRTSPSFPGEAKFQEDFATQPGVTAGAHSAVAASFFHQNPYVIQKNMPAKIIQARTRIKKRQEEKASIQADALIREEIRELKRGSGNVRSRKQAIAIGLSKARRAGKKIGTPKKTTTSATRKKSTRDSATRAGLDKPSLTHSLAQS